MDGEDAGGVGLAEVRGFEGFRMKMWVGRGAERLDVLGRKQEGSVYNDLIAEPRSEGGCGRGRISEL